MSLKLLQEEIGTIEPNSIKPYISEGRWSAHTLLSYLLDYTGDADVWISSFSLCEDAVRLFVTDPRIKKLYCLFDRSILHYKRDLFFFLQQKAEMRLAANHSKIFIVEGKERNVAVLTSANLSINRRIEAGTIITDPNFYKVKERFIDLFNNSNLV
jgi:hypothetical protein